MDMPTLNDLKEFVNSLSLSDRQELSTYLESLNDDSDFSTSLGSVGIAFLENY